MRLAQDFAARYPLIDGQGNFGNIDGDNAAAMRYTEARLTEVAEALLEGIDEDAVDFRPTYDGEDQEPVVLPANFPNLLANGAHGHRGRHGDQHPAAQCRRALRRAAAPHQGVRTRASRRWSTSMPGPDFPTGGVLVEPREAIVEAYRTGRGGFRLRARWDDGEAQGRRLPDRRHRDSLPGAEVAS